MNGRWRTAVLALACTPAVVLLTACGHKGAAGVALPRGVMSAHRACALVLKGPRGTFVGIKQVHLVLTTYGKGEPLETRGNNTSGNPRPLVWVVEVHAKAINVPHSVPPDTRRTPPATEFSVVMNARTGLVSNFGLGGPWPIPLWKVGTMISLPAHC